MTQASLDTDPAAPVAMLVSLTWESADAFYTSWNTPLELGGVIYTPLPGIEVAESALTGSLEEENWLLTAPRQFPPFTNTSRPYPHERISVSIIKVDPRDPAGSRRRIYRGRVIRARGNPNGRRGVVELECRGPKGLTDVPLGVTVSSDCDNIFGNEGGSLCGIDLAVLRKVATLLSSNPSVPQAIRADPAPFNFTSLADARSTWEAGDVRIGGLRIKIIQVAEITNDYVEFLLVRIPPPEWTAAGVSLAQFTPGCRKTYSACLFWENTDRFRGSGVVIQEYNPSFENPPGTGGELP